MTVMSARTPSPVDPHRPLEAEGRAVIDDLRGGDVELAAPGQQLQLAQLIRARLVQAVGLRVAAQLGVLALERIDLALAGSDVRQPAEEAADRIGHGRHAPLDRAEGAAGFVPGGVEAVVPRAEDEQGGAHQHEGDDDDPVAPTSPHHP
jgi:hypothetical protein